MSRLPASCMGIDAAIGATIRGSRVIVPRRDTVSEDGDRVVVFALPSAAGAVGKLFTQERICLPETGANQRTGA